MGAEDDRDGSAGVNSLACKLGTCAMNRRTPSTKPNDPAIETDLKSDGKFTLGWQRWRPSMEAWSRSNPVDYARRLRRAVARSIRHSARALAIARLNSANTGTWLNPPGSNCFPSRF